MMIWQSLSRTMSVNETRVRSLFEKYKAACQGFIFSYAIELILQDKDYQDLSLEEKVLMTMFLLGVPKP